MKPATFLAGLLFGIAISAIAASMIGVTVDLVHHDATGRVQHSTAQLNSIIQYGTTVSIDYTSDQLYCSGFGP